MKKISEISGSVLALVISTGTITATIIAFVALIKWLISLI